MFNEVEYIRGRAADCCLSNLVTHVREAVVDVNKNFVKQTTPRRYQTVLCGSTQGILGLGRCVSVSSEVFARCSARREVARHISKNAFDDGCSLCANDTHVP